MKNTKQELNNYLTENLNHYRDYIQPHEPETEDGSIVVPDYVTDAVLSKILLDFEEWLKDNVVSVDSNTNEILVAVNSNGLVVPSLEGNEDCRWQNAVAIFMSEVEKAKNISRHSEMERNTVKRNDGYCR